MIYNVAITKKDLIGYLNCIENFKKIDKKIKTAHRSKIEKFLEEFIKNDFKDIIKNFDKKKYDSDYIKKYVMSIFDEKLIAKQYLDLLKFGITVKGYIHIMTICHQLNLKR